MGTPAYALFTEACVAVMDVDPGALGMTEHRETYEDLGEVTGWVHDLGAAWVAELERRRVIVTDRDAGYVYEGELPAPRDVVWSFMTDPALRPLWQADVTAVDQLPTTARRGVGTTNHCMHGSDVLIEEILDWRPTDYYTVRTTLPNGFVALSTFAYEDIPDGTAIRMLFTWGRNRKEREAMAGAKGLVATSSSAAWRTCGRCWPRRCRPGPRPGRTPPTSPTPRPPSTGRSASRSAGSAGVRATRSRTQRMRGGDTERHAANPR